MREIGVGHGVGLFDGQVPPEAKDFLRHLDEDGTEIASRLLAHPD